MGPTSRTQRENLLFCSILDLAKKSTMDQMIFSNKKYNFLIDTPPVNTHNCRVDSKENLKRNVPAANLIIERKHFLKKMVSTGVSKPKRGKGRIYFVDNKSKILQTLKSVSVEEHGLYLYAAPFAQFAFEGRYGRHKNENSKFKQNSQ
uniref:Uncharacterized protein n=1 Tax=Romanomermis culicivorax TaxID=13658 RepID=A0A915IWI1_ROMCU